MDIHVGMGGPQELLRLLSQLADKNGRDDDEEKRALFIIGQHPDIEAEYKKLDGFDEYAKKQLDELAEMLKQRAEFLKREHKTLHSSVWEAIELLMKEKGLCPSEYNKKNDDEYLSVREGVMYYVKKK